MAQQRPRLLPSIVEILDDEPVERDSKSGRAQARIIEQTLASFDIPAQVRNIHAGPRLTLFSLKPGPAVQLSQITRLEQDIAVALSGTLFAIEEPRPDYAYITLVVENNRSPNVKLRSILETPNFQRFKGAIKFGLGLDNFGKPVIIDLATLPHLLIGGMTGSGKSIFLHATIAGLLCTYPPEELKLLLIDPMALEFKRYNGLSHLAASVVTERLQVIEALQQILDEIERRYREMSKAGVRNIATYNQRAVRLQQSQRAQLSPMPYLVIIIDNMFDLMMDAPRDLEQAMTRIAQKARGAGIHVIMATVRSNVDTIAGSIKANFPGRIAFQVANRADSQLIIDAPGAEMLSGHGDMLYKSPETGRLLRIQGINISEQELDRIINFWYRS